MSDNILAEYWNHESQYRDKGVEESINIQSNIDSLLCDYWQYQKSLHNTNIDYATKLVA
jgi:hypothetical protein